jgi:hypothetical protein
LVRTLKLPRVQFTVRQSLLFVGVAALVIAPLARWSQQKADRDRIVAIAAREYQKKFGMPAPPYVKLPAYEAAHISFQWDRRRSAYIVGFAHQSVVNKTRDFFGNPVPYESGSTTEHFFSVAPDGHCEYTGMKAGGEY